MIALAVPRPRTPVCLVHHVWHASCAACTDQRKAERLAALERLREAR